jgi:PASTA domain/Fibronectin type III domain
VVIGAGEYGSVSAPIGPLNMTENHLDVHGAPGPRPRLTMDSNGGNAVFMASLSAHLSDVEIRQIDGTGILTYGEVERVVVSTISDNEVACVVQGAIRDSVCLASGTNGVAFQSGDDPLVSEVFARAVNVTAIATGPGGVGIRVRRTTMGSDFLTVTNSIARGTAFGISAVTNGSFQTATINIHHSNYAGVQEAGLGDPLVLPSEGNQAVQPLFVNAAAGDYRQAPGSPTVDAGTDNLFLGPLDFEGQLRVLGSAPDIGADELPVGPLVTTGAAESVTGTTAVVTGQVDGRGSPTTYRLEYGATTAYGSSTPERSTSGREPLDAAFALSGLEPRTTYHARVVAANVAGSSAGQDLTFTTAAGAAKTCKVPRLRGKTLKKARATLRKAGCRLGKVKQPKRNGGRLVVKRQSPKAGRTVPQGTKVRVTLGRKR